MTIKIGIPTCCPSLCVTRSRSCSVSTCSVWFCLPGQSEEFWRFTQEVAVGDSEGGSHRKLVTAPASSLQVATLLKQLSAAMQRFFKLALAQSLSLELRLASSGHFEFSLSLFILVQPELEIIHVLCPASDSEVGKPWSQHQ